MNQDQEAACDNEKNLYNNEDNKRIVNNVLLQQTACATTTTTTVDPTIVQKTKIGMKRERWNEINMHKLETNEPQCRCKDPLQVHDKQE